MALLPYLFADARENVTVVSGGIVAERLNTGVKLDRVVEFCTTVPLGRRKEKV